LGGATFAFSYLKKYPLNSADIFNISGEKGGTKMTLSASPHQPWFW
jgi:hypothetical protein